MFKFEGVVRNWNRYGDQVVSKTPMTVTANNKAEAVKKAREAFGATYDTFRKFWSCDFVVTSVSEVADREGS